MKIKTSDNAISQIIASTLLLLMVLAILSTVYMYVLSYPPPNPAPDADIVATLEAGNIILEHRGGELLDLNTEVILKIGGSIENITVGEDNYLDSDSKADGVWGIGERLIYTPAQNITNLQVEATVIDRAVDSVLMTGVIQEGQTGAILETPTVTTKGYNIWFFVLFFADLDMDYDFKDNISGEVRFAYKWQISPFWSYTPWKSKAGSGSYTRTIIIFPLTTYEYKAQLRYDSNIIEGETKTFP